MGSEWREILKQSATRCLLSTVIRRIQHARRCATLVLSRKQDESLVIGDNIVVTIVDIREEKVRLGIEAPCEIPVHRQEVHDAIQRENAKAPKPSSPPTPKPCLLSAAKDARLWLMGSPHHLECKAETIIEVIDNLTIAINAREGEGKGCNE